MSTERSLRTRFALVVLAGLALAPEQRAAACGPDFPTNPLLHRADALATLWDGSFLDEAAHLVEVDARDRELFTREPELIAATPREEALYRAAAERFHADDFVAAARGFEALLRLPARERRRRSVEAAYSLARAYEDRAMDAQAIGAYRQVRALVRDGFVDPDGLALASLGQEARLEWGDCDAARCRPDAGRAAQLYAQQAALGDSGAAVSLLYLVRMAFAERTADAYREALERDDVGVSLLALYAYTRHDELAVAFEPRCGEPRDDDDSGDAAPPPCDHGKLDAWLTGLRRRATTEARGAAYLAAAAYRAGDWTAAAELAARCTRAPIALWVRAKLALRDGDRPQAEALLLRVETSRLASAPSTPPEDLDEDPGSLVRGELGILALAGDRFPEAAGWFARGDRDVEAGYVADRVMSRDELLATARDDGGTVAPEGDCEAWQLTGTCWHHSLLGMYARRSVRAQRFADALDTLGDDAPEREHVEHLASELGRAGATTGIERAEHLFAAARTLREHGMEIAGTEVGPDWHIYEGDYERAMPCLPSPAHGFARYGEPTDENYGMDDGGCTLPTRADAALTSPLEIARVRASAPEDDQRFSYRYAASRLAEQAAGLVPPRSQAYAALLCWAAAYAHRDGARVEELYAMYVRNGASGFSIGEDCPAPDFARARRFDEDQATRRANAATAAERARWTWPRMRAAVWRRRAWLVYPPLALVVLGLSLLVGRAALRRSMPL